MAIVYVHRRNSDNQIFYIGISKNKKRPYSSRGRNYFWKKEVKDHLGYKVEIVKSDLSYEEAQQLEIKLILEYGRRDSGTGLLVNLTDGGEGTIGYIRSEESNKKLSISKKSVSHLYKTKEFRDTMSTVTKGEKNGMYGKNHSEEAKQKIKNSWNNERKEYYKKINSGSKNPMFGKKNQDLSNRNKNNTLGNNPRARKILQYDKNGKFIAEYSCIKEAEKITKVTHIADIIKGRRKENKNYIFKYKEDEHKSITN